MKNYTYNHAALTTLLHDLLKANLSPEAMEWLEQSVSSAQAELPLLKFKVAFSMISRKVPSKAIEMTAEQKQSLEQTYALSLQDWDTQRLSRIWLLLHLPAEDKQAYIRKINELFSMAEMSELAALYAALPLLAFPEEWKLRAAEGVRSNIGIVLDAIIMNNTYPSKYLDENAWNQLILKAFFTDKNIDKIIGIKERANQSLANSLKDYIAERQAAGRDVNAKLWELIEINEIEK